MTPFDDIKAAASRLATARVRRFAVVKGIANPNEHRNVIDKRIVKIGDEIEQQLAVVSTDIAMLLAAVEGLAQALEATVEDEHHNTRKHARLARLLVQQMRERYALTLKENL